MNLIGLLVEGQTEEIFFEKLLLMIQNPDLLCVSKRLDEVLDDTRENRIWLKSVGGDRSFPSYIKKSKRAFILNNFDRLILIRDYAPDDRPPVSLCKKDLCTEILRNIPQDVIERYSNKIFFNLSVQEIEAWFFVDKDMFRELKEELTEDYLNENYNNILEQNPEEIDRPCSKLKKILRNEVGYKYTKSKDSAYHIISSIDMDNYIGEVSENYAQSLNRIIEFFLNTL